MHPLLLHQFGNLAQKKMKLSVIILFFCYLTSTYCQKPFEKTIEGEDVLTKDIFEDAFTGYEKAAFRKGPTPAYLFAYIAFKNGDDIDKQVQPVCHVTLVRHGIGLIDEKCVEQINMYQKNGANLQIFHIVYRCYRNDTQTFDALDYEIRHSKIDKIGRDRGFWVLFFTPQSDSHCQPKWLEDIGIDQDIQFMKEQAGDQLLDFMRIEDADLLTKEQYEAAFKGVTEQFYSNPDITYIFSRSLKGRVTKRLEPIKQCLVTMYDNGKGTIHPKCVGLLDVLFKMDDTMRNVLLPYRCYLNDNPTEYELYSTNIFGFGREKESLTEQYFIAFDLPKLRHCTPKLNKGRVEEGDNRRRDTNYWKEMAGELMSLEGADPLTKEQYEAAFKGVMEQFYFMPESTFIFRRDISRRTNSLTPVKQCFVTMADNGKAAIHQKCHELMEIFKGLDDTMLNWLLPYRCFLNDNPSIYELHNTTITGFGIAKQSQEEKYYITFRLPEMSHCKAKLGKASEEEEESLNWSKSEL